MADASKTIVTELATALGTIRPNEEAVLGTVPDELRFVDEAVWSSLGEAFLARVFSSQFTTAFENGRAFRAAADGLRMRPPRLVEWKGRHRPPGEDVTPADLRIDHVYQVSCKYQSKILANAGPSRLFDYLLASERRVRLDWFLETAPFEYQSFYEATREWSQLDHLPPMVADLTASDRVALREMLRPRKLAVPLQSPWLLLASRVAEASAARWARNLADRSTQLRMLWRLTRIGDAPYFLLGAHGRNSLRLRVSSRWDWVQRYELKSFTVASRVAGQPEVSWLAVARERASRRDLEVGGHVEVRWSHGRFAGLPEAKVVLDTPIDQTPGYFTLS